MIPIKRILWPTDFSEPSYVALDWAAGLAERLEAELLCLHVQELPPHNSEWADASKFRVPLAVQEERKAILKKMETIIAAREQKNLIWSPLVQIDGAADGIVKVAGEESANLIVIATHGLTGWRRLVFGSVTETVVRSSPCPVLTIPPPETEHA